MSVAPTYLLSLLLREIDKVAYSSIVREASHPFASYAVRGSDCSPCLSPLGSTGADDGSPSVLEGFIIQTDDESQSGSKSQIRHDSFQLPRTTAESASLIEQIRKSACRTTPSLHLTKTFKFNGKLNLDQSVSTELLDVMFFSQNLEGSSVFDNMEINHDYTGNMYTDCVSFSGASSSADARNLPASPTGKLWYRSFQNQTPELPCISEEDENIDEEPENLCANTPKSMSSEKRGSSVPDLPCITEENENIDEMSEAVNEVSDSEREDVSPERKPIAHVIEGPKQFLPSVSKAELPVDRQSLDSVNTTFSFSATCNNSVKSKAGRQKGGSRRFAGKGKENQGGAGAGRNVRDNQKKNLGTTTLFPTSRRSFHLFSSKTSTCTNYRKKMTEDEERSNEAWAERQEQENLRKLEMEKKKKEEE
ncbi:hypothetical protein Bca52824_035940 [Brassica carinata]|uniref:Uncharacterized protein n=1 Tax=Brassica carinata TaxID=52824 RepID=A0A8X7S1Q8_BRACI|nr:hypothetical protein Bca52824_035940 [Brassica carinata]